MTPALIPLSKSRRMRSATAATCDRRRSGRAPGPASRPAATGAGRPDSRARRRSRRPSPRRHRSLPSGGFGGGMKRRGARALGGKREVAKAQAHGLGAQPAARRRRSAGTPGPGRRSVRVPRRGRDRPRRSAGRRRSVRRRRPERVEDQVRAGDLERRRRGVRPSARFRARRSAPASGSASPTPRGRRRRRARPRPSGESPRAGSARGRAACERRCATRCRRSRSRPARPRVADLAQHLLVDRELVGADRAEVVGIEAEHELAAAKVRQADLLSPVVGEREVRRLAAGLEHGPGG